ncbi:hypothetical protein JMJ56_27330 [Belnapia sp. T18]|uniref:Lipoprotein n=1 Tax=Belnapia arida TaxID=2804533 RepID=A0ABS1UCM1_9PROT|nr:hypothetical protein [Belnapia arida]MBL6081699.1 hypothetical protein [Belnapia arida]
MMERLLIALLPVLAAGCTTLTQGTSQEISFNTPKAEGAQCVVTNDQGDILARVTAPASVRVLRGRRDLTVHCDKEGFRSGIVQVASSFSSRSRIQVPLGYAVDGISGAMWSYPTEVSVMLVPQPN